MTTPDETAMSLAERTIGYGTANAGAVGRALIEAFERLTEARRRIACAQRTEQQIRAIVRDEISRAFVPPMVLVTDPLAEAEHPEYRDGKWHYPGYFPEAGGAQ